MLAHARTVVGDVDRLKARSRSLAEGLEPELSIAVDVMFPMEKLTTAVTAFHAAFPLTPPAPLCGDFGCGHASGVGWTRRARQAYPTGAD